MPETTNGICRAHSGFDERIKDVEDNVTQLWKKWDRMNVLLIGILVTGLVNLVLMLAKGLTP